MYCYWFWLILVKAVQWQWDLHFQRHDMSLPFPFFFILGVTKSRKWRLLLRTCLIFKDVGKRYGGEKSVKNTKVWDAAKIHNGMIEFTDRMSLQDCFLCLHKRRVNGYRLKVFLRWFLLQFLGVIYMELCSCFSSDTHFGVAACV